MKQFTEAEVTAIGEATVQAYMRAASEKKAAAGRAAVDAVAPRVLAEPDDTEISRSGGDARWDGGDYARARRLFANRLISLTAKPDPAVEAVKAEVYRQGKERRLDFRWGLDFDAIVAAVDAARGAK